MNLDKDFICISGVDYKYESYNCHGCYGCDSGDDYCRGSRYEGLEVEINLEDFIKYNFNKESLLSQYCIFKFLDLNDFTNKDDWEIDTCGGYYGDEIGRITYLRSGSLQTPLNNLLSLSDLEKVQSIMQMEYGLFSPAINSAEIELKVDIKDIFIPNAGYLDVVSTKSFFKDFPVCVCIRKEGGLKLVDGYHRLKKAKEENKRKINVLVISK